MYSVINEYECAHTPNLKNYLQNETIITNIVHYYTFQYEHWHCHLQKILSTY
jgi:hypothetical protein